MRSWAAVTAALLILILTALAVSISFVDAADSVNQASQKAINDLCRTLGLDTAEMTDEERIATLEPLQGKLTQAYCLVDEDGSVLLQSDHTAVLPRDRSKLTTVITFQHFSAMSERGELSLYAVYHYADGGMLVFLIPSEDWLSIASDNAWTILLLFVGLCITALLIYICVSTRSRQVAVARLMKTLDEIAEGDFDARIEPIPGQDNLAGEYNAVLDRLQNRIFKQRNRNKALSVIVTQMQNGIIAVDQYYRVMLVTPVAKEMFGIIGNPEGKLVNDLSKDIDLRTVFQEAMQQCGVYTNDVVARAAVGRGHRPLRMYVSPMRNNNELVGALAMVEDISELARLEQMRTDFAANVSHELKTPLTSIRGFVETLQDGAIEHPETARKFLRIISMETERLTRLINDILSISKLESGRDEVSVGRIRLDRMADDLCEMLSINASEKNVTVTCKKTDRPIFILGNSDRVEQMLINIIENGIKYNKPGGKVLVHVFSTGDKANVTVSDTGIGIAEENIPRLFERFYRVDKGRSREMGGTGLGLAIVKHIVKSMNGDIEVSSKLGEGTEFLITLPLYRAGEDEEADEQMRKGMD
ncbi:MAG: PAS domain S-box protein [Clostridia bacterium]|nr:PAS domain S-box protein [Clostridia bacterium]